VEDNLEEIVSDTFLLKISFIENNLAAAFFIEVNLGGDKGKQRI
jgi:hypothetical protein